MRDWVRKNREVFERDVLQDFCLASDQFRQHFVRVAETASVSFPVLRSMVGEPRNKGLLWRLKDKAHHIFLRVGQGNPVGLLLDWTLGYIFHESLKLMEDAHQRQYYAPRLAGLDVREEESGLSEATPDALAVRLSPEVAAISAGLRRIQEETCESMRREAARLQTLLLHARRLFCLYFAGCSGHRPLARFLNDNGALVRRVFQEDHAHFLQAIYGDEPERLYLEAALSLLDSARNDAAVLAVEAALGINPASSEALRVRKTYRL